MNLMNFALMTVIASPVVVALPENYVKGPKGYNEMVMTEKGLGRPVIETKSGSLQYVSSEECMVGDLKEEIVELSDDHTDIEKPVFTIDFRKSDPPHKTIRARVGQYVYGPYAKYMYLEHPHRNPALSNADFAAKCQGHKFLGAVYLGKRVGLAQSRVLEGATEQARNAFEQAVRKDTQLPKSDFLAVKEISKRLETLANAITEKNSSNPLEPVDAHPSVSNRSLSACYNVDSDKCKKNIELALDFVRNHLPQEFDKTAVQAGKAHVVLGDFTTPRLETFDAYISKEKM